MIIRENNELFRVKEYADPPTTIIEENSGYTWNFVGAFSIDELMQLHKFLTELLLSKGYDPNDKSYFEE